VRDHVITGAILVGGDSTRMGQDKASMLWQGRPLLHHVHGIIAPLCEEVLVVTRQGRIVEIPRSCRAICDEQPGRGPLVGIHAALSQAANERTLVVACDMPWLQAPLLAAMRDEGQADVVIPRGPHGWEPLHAIYHRRCLPAIEDSLADGPCRVPAFFDRVTVEAWDRDRCLPHDPNEQSFLNINRPDDLPSDMTTFPPQ